MKRKTTNWQKFYKEQMKDQELNALVEEELRSLRIGAKLASLRQQKKLSQTKLAALTGMSAPNISRIENDPGRNLTIGTMTKIAFALGLEPQISFKSRTAKTA